MSKAKRVLIRELTAEEVAAVAAYAAEHGKAWKSDLSAEWARGSAPTVLYRLRNDSQWGPRGLVAYNGVPS